MFSNHVLMFYQDAWKDGTSIECKLVIKYQSWIQITHQVIFCFAWAGLCVTRGDTKKLIELHKRAPETPETCLSFPFWQNILVCLACDQFFWRGILDRVLPLDEGSEAQELAAERVVFFWIQICVRLRNVDYHQ